jgi:acyl-CoA synthetase (NDP forming)
VDVNRFVQRVLESGRTALSEAESKRILRHYGVPVVTETTVSTAEEAVAAANGMAFPVVLKGIGDNVLHKTESGLVHLHLTDDAAVRRAAKEILRTASGMKLLVQPQIKGDREFVAGLFRDPQFGPAILFGLGGIFTEALADVAFRLAPLSERDALDMIASIRSRTLLGAFRGAAAVDRQSLLRTLMGLSALATDVSEIAEIDINPLIATASGDLMAVDALITLAGPEGRAADLPRVTPWEIHALFYPRSVAFIGASSELGKWGHTLICNAISGGYRGKVHAVNPKGGTIAGRPVYKSVEQIPGPVDLAVVTIPAAGVLDLMPQLKAKGIKKVVMVTSGFAETGPEGKVLERQLVAAAWANGIHILGPNTMGICNPHIDFFCTGAPVRPMAGTTAVVAQSGNMGVQLLAFAEQQGIGIRAFSGSGNEAMITIEDYLEGFEVDELTQTVMLYVESVKQGRRFFESARRLSKKKPIVLLKGGQTQAGNRAAASHTGAMASDTRLFDAVCRQAGIVKVDQPMELLDLSAAFSSLPLPRGNRIAIMTLGGGWGVVTADLCSQFGLDVPALGAALISRIDKVLPPYWSRSNPIDLVGENDPSLPITVMETLLAWDGCDAVIMLGIMGRRIFLKRMAESVRQADPSYTGDFLDGAVGVLSEWENNYIVRIVQLMENYAKPIVGVSLLTDRQDITVRQVDGHALKAVFYETPEQAVKALAHMVAYQAFRSRHSISQALG